MTAHRRPPVIPEIAKAYQDDPRTKLALAAMGTGTSNAPVAQGRYAYADGIARALQGAMGGYQANKQADAYGADQDALLALRKARGVDGLTGAAGAAAGPATPPPPLPPGMRNDDYGGAAGQVGNAPVDDYATAAATALGAPPAAPTGPSQGPGLPGLPTAPIPPTAPPGGPPAQGGGPGGRRPFGPNGANAPAYLQAPTPEPIPDAPAPVAKPVTPEAVGPTKSRMLNAAYRVMADANPYESAGGQDMYGEGLKEQTHLDESAAERKQKLADMGYGADLNAYGEAQNQDRSAKYADRTAAQQRNFQAVQAVTERAFQHDEKGLDRSNQIQLERMRAASALQVAKVKDETSNSGSTALTDEERLALSKAVGDGRIDLKGITKFQAKVVAQSLVDNPGLDAIHLHARAMLAANSPAQQKAALVSAMPTVLTNVRDAGTKLKFSDVQFAGKLQAFAKGQFNDPDFINYMTQRNDAMQTLAQIMRGTGATDQATRLESDAAPKSMSPRAWEAWYQGQMTALRPRIEMYEKRGLLDPGTTKDVYGSGPASGGGVPQRKPGETVQQYLARTGGQ